MPRRFSKPSMPPTHQNSEHWHQSKFFAIVRRVPHPAVRVTYASVNGFLRTKAMRIRAWQEGAMAGVLDVHNGYPMLGRGHPGQYIEFKAGKNTLTKEQEDFRDQALSLGYRVDVVYSWEEGIEVWCDYLDIDLKMTPTDV